MEKVVVEQEVGLKIIDMNLLYVGQEIINNVTWWCV
jgi:hypothetical protein